MYKIIKQGDEDKIFTADVMDEILSNIAEDTTATFENSDEKDKSAFGMFALHDVTLKKGGTTNVWVEYTAKLLDDGEIDAVIHECITYDEIPDIVLDKYNEMKRMEEEDLNKKKS